MKTMFLKQAEENGHKMSLVAPERYECCQCPASIVGDETGCGNWQSSKIGIVCPGAEVRVDPIGSKRFGRMSMA